MKIRGALPRVVWVLLGLLIISSFVFVMGSNETSAFPSADSYRPSGTHAFYELLKAQGYDVAATEDPNPHLNSKSDVVIGFDVAKTLFGVPVPRNPNETDQQPFIHRFVANGGRAALFGLDEDFQSQSDVAAEDVVDLSPNGDSKSSLKVNLSEPSIIWEEAAGMPLSLGGDRYQSLPAFLSSQGKGELLVIKDGIIATNRFIGRNDNAQQLMLWLKALAPTGSRIVFYEASFGNAAEPTVFSVLGAWSSAAWLQLIFLFVIVIYTLGKPFGYPDEVRKKQKGARDLVDAVAMLYRRAKAGGPVLKKIYQDADHELRTRLKLPSEADTAERDRLLPSELVDVLHRIESWSNLKVKPTDALPQVQRLDRLMAEFLGERRAVRKKRRAA